MDMQNRSIIPYESLLNNIKLTRTVNIGLTVYELLSSSVRVFNIKTHNPEC